jgi:hypothetical protein
MNDSPVVVEIAAGTEDITFVVTLEDVKDIILVRDLLPDGEGYAVFAVFGV